MHTDFERGPYDEIFPTPLVAGFEPEAVLRAMVGEETYRAMGPGERRAFYGEAMVYAHQQNLLRALGGELSGDPEAEALYRAVVEERRPVSLRPLGMEGLSYTTFAPVLRRMGDDEWQVGLPGVGFCCTTLTGDAPAVLRRAWALYVAWAEAEEGGGAP